MKRTISIFFLLPVAILAADTNATPGLVPAYGEMPTTFWEEHHIAVILSGIALLAGGALVLVLLLRPEPPIVLTPEAIARQALAKLQGRPEDGKLLSEVSQILRRYIAAALGLPPVEMTTAEFCATIAANEKMGGELAKLITGFLHECDDRKFSATPPVVPLGGTARALMLVDMVEEHRLRSASGEGSAS